MTRDHLNFPKYLRRCLFPSTNSFPMMSRSRLSTFSLFKCKIMTWLILLRFVGPVISLNNHYKSCRLQSCDTCLLLILYLNCQYEWNVKSIYYIRSPFWELVPKLIVVNGQEAVCCIMGISVVMCYSWLVNLKGVDITWNNNVFSLWWTPSFSLISDGPVNHTWIVWWLNAVLYTVDMHVQLYGDPFHCLFQY